MSSGQQQSSEARAPNTALAAIDALRVGLEHHQAGRLGDAQTAYREALSLDPDNAEALHLLGVLANQVGDNEAAVTLIERAIQRDRTHADYHTNLGVALAALDRGDEAEAAYRRALDLDPCHGDALANLGRLMEEAGRSEQAVTMLRQALAVRPDDPEIHNDLAVVLVATNRLAEAIPHYRRSLALNPADPETHFNLSRALLQSGEFVAGWAEAEWRWQTKYLAGRRRTFEQPQWDGTALEGRRLLLYAEQGVGDTIHYVRFVQQAACCDGHIILECHPALVRLLSTIPGVEQVVGAGDPLPEFDLHLPIMSLPYVFGIDAHALPRPVPYLAAPAPRHAALDLSRTAGRKVGIVWSGDVNRRKNERRSCPIDVLAALFDVPGIEFYSLQVGPPEADLSAYADAGRVHDLAPALSDFADTASVIAQLDIVISVDTSVAHLSGALGRPSWILLSYAPDWRWSSTTSECLWYPSARLFRQSEPGGWDAVVAKVRDELAAAAGA